MEYQDKVAFITGGASGIGFAIAKAVAQRGVKVVLADIQDEALAQSVKVIEELGVDAMGIRLDVADRAAVYGAADEDLSGHDADSFMGTVGGQQAAALFAKHPPLAGAPGINVLRDPALPPEAPYYPVPMIGPRDVSEAVLWLASDESRFVTGTQLRVDAGSNNRV